LGQYKSNPYENFKDKYITKVLSAHIELYIYIYMQGGRLDWKVEKEDCENCGELPSVQDVTG
jgi:hypothetical protein